MKLRTVYQISISFVSFMILGLVNPQLASTNPLQHSSDRSTCPSHSIKRSGIEGKVLIGPINPVERPGVANERPYQADVTILNQAGKIITHIQSDKNGQFRVILKPGKYILRPESPGILPRAQEQAVTVTQKTFTQVRVVYDSGIR